MTFLPPFEDPDDKKKKDSQPSLQRIAIWVLVGGVGIFLVVTGLLGIDAKSLF